MEGLLTHQLLIERDLMFGLLDLGELFDIESQSLFSQTMTRLLRGGPKRIQRDIGREDARKARMASPNRETVLYDAMAVSINP